MSRCGGGHLGADSLDSNRANGRSCVCSSEHRLLRFAVQRLVLLPSVLVLLCVVPGRARRRWRLRCADAMRSVRWRRRWERRRQRLQRRQIAKRRHRVCRRRLRTRSTNAACAASVRAVNSEGGQRCAAASDACSLLPTAHCRSSLSLLSRWLAASRHQWRRSADRRQAGPACCASRC